MHTARLVSTRLVSTRLVTARTAAFLAAALLAAMVAPVGGFAAGAPSEACLSCAGCESGACDEDAASPTAEHHHCCIAGCMAHASLAFGAPLFSPSPLPAELAPASPRPDTIRRSPDVPYHPPRG